MDEGLIEVLNNFKKEIQDDKVIIARIDELDQRYDARFKEVEKRMDEYAIFISKTSGLFTRIGFYLDAFVIYLRGLLKK